MPSAGLNPRREHIEYEIGCIFPCGDFSDLETKLEADFIQSRLDFYRIIFEGTVHRIELNDEMWPDAVVFNIPRGK
jgi:hypothetical protein